jgi:hypothetical protein
VSQPTGDGLTTFVIHGQNWPGRTRLTLRLAGVAAAAHPVTDDRGMFNYAINQDHEFFPRGLPAGILEVSVSGPHGRTARARFEVLPPPGG